MVQVQLVELVRCYGERTGLLDQPEWDPEEIIRSIVHLTDVAERGSNESLKIEDPRHFNGRMAYPVPVLGPDGKCTGELESKQYPLSLRLQQALRLNGMQAGRFVRNFSVVLEEAHCALCVDWIGGYVRVQLPGQEHETLLKLAYQGSASRAEFPLTWEFANPNPDKSWGGSSNSTVGLTGKAIAIGNVSTHKGCYFVCDRSVRSELCLPVFNANWELVGIIDAEARSEGFFNKEAASWVIALAIVTGQQELFAASENLG